MAAITYTAPTALAFGSTYVVSETEDTLSALSAEQKSDGPAVAQTIQFHNRLYKAGETPKLFNRGLDPLQVMSAAIDAASRMYSSNDIADTFSAKIEAMSLANVVFATVPTVTSSAASSTTTTGTTLNGNLTVLGNYPTPVEKGFVWSLTATNAAPAIGGTGVTKVVVGTVAATGAYTQALTGLTLSTQYSFNSYVTGADGVTRYGTARTVTTSAS